MLNELLIAERGARLAGVEMAQRHPDIKDAGKKPTLRVRLGARGDVAGIDPVPEGVSLWTLGKGNKKRFPFMQPNAPMLRLPRELDSDHELMGLVKLKGHHRRQRLVELCKVASFNNAALGEWPGVRDKNGGWSQEPGDYLAALRSRRQQLERLRETDGECVIAMLDRFLAACEEPDGGPKLLREVAQQLVATLEAAPSDDWTRVAESILLLGGGALFFDVPSVDFPRLVSDPAQVVLLTQVLSEHEDGLNAAAGDGGDGIQCALTGQISRLVEDARIFGNTFLEDIKGKNFKPGEKDHFISTGVVQFGPGVSIAPIEVERLTTTNKSGVQEGKDRGMAPLGWRVVRHGVYAMPLFVNPMMAVKSGCRLLDIQLMQFLIPHAYRNTASAIRPFVEVRHVWYAEHKSPLGSCPDSLILDAMTPTKVKGAADEPSSSLDEYEIPTELPADLRSRLASFQDLCIRQWG